MYNLKFISSLNANDASIEIAGVIADEVYNSVNDSEKWLYNFNNIRANSCIRHTNDGHFLEVIADVRKYRQTVKRLKALPQIKLINKTKIKG